MHHCLAPLLRAYYEWLSCVVHTICMFSYIPCTHACVCVRVGVFASSPAQSEQARDSSIAHSVCHYKAINSIQRNKLSSKNKTQSSATKFPSWNTTTNRYSRRLPLPFRCDDSLPKKKQTVRLLTWCPRACCVFACVCAPGKSGSHSEYTHMSLVCPVPVSVSVRFPCRLRRVAVASSASSASTRLL